jgi:MFS family permease
MGATLLFLLLVDPQRDLLFVGVVLFFGSAFASFQDVGVDALAVDLLRTEEMGIGNGTMWAGRAVGTAVGGGGGMVVAKYLGWSALICGITGLIWMVTLFLILVPERPRDEEDPAHEHPKQASPELRNSLQRGDAAPKMEVRTTKQTLAELRKSFSFAAPLVGIVLGMLGPISGALTTNVFIRYLRVDVKLSTEALGTLEAVIAPLAGAGGGFLGGWLASRFGMRKVIGVLLICLGVAGLVFAFLPEHRSSLTFLTLWLATATFIGGAYSACMYGLFMMLSNPAVGATQFSIFLAAAALTGIWGPALGGWIADSYSVTTLYLVAAAAQVASIVLLPFCDPREAKARFRMEAAGGAP